MNRQLSYRLTAFLEKKRRDAQHLLRCEHVPGGAKEMAQEEISECNNLLDNLYHL